MKNIRLLLTIGLILLPMSVDAQSMTDYQCFPIFTTSVVTPNIMIMLDNSGSMNFMAYGYTNGYYHPDDFDPNVSYYGYFNPDAKYTYAISNEFDMDPAGDWDGSFLNWLTMRRVDLARKVLVGGLATSRTGGGNQKLYGETPAQESRKFFKFYSNSSAYTPAASASNGWRRQLSCIAGSSWPGFHSPARPLKSGWSYSASDCTARHWKR